MRTQRYLEVKRNANTAFVGGEADTALLTSTEVAHLDSEWRHTSGSTKGASRKSWLGA